MGLGEALGRLLALPLDARLRQLVRPSSPKGSGARSLTTCVDNVYRRTVHSVLAAGEERGQMFPQHVPDSQEERDTLAMLRLREVMPKGWTIETRGPILYRHGVVNWEVEA